MIKYFNRQLTLAELGLYLVLDDHSESLNRVVVLPPSTGLGHALILRLTQSPSA